MKEKLVLILAILLMAAPAMAVVNFTAEDAGSGQLKISYICDDGELPRGVALKVTITGSGEIQSDADVVSSDAGYNTYIDWANSNPAGYAVGDGHPFADPAGAGVVTFPASEFSVCMGVLDETGNQLPGPGTSADLITIQLHGSGTVGVVVDADYSRAPNGGNGGGAVGSVLATNLPLDSVDVVLAPPVECMMATHPDYVNWLYWNKPACWCYERQCRGDIDGKVLGPFWVSGNDLVIFKTAISKLETAIPAGGICADLDHAKLGPFWVSGNDLAIFKQYISKLAGSVPPCDSTYINFWEVPTP